MYVKENIVLENARLFFRNFAGKAGRYNKEGDRNFCVRLDNSPVSAEKLEEDGWNVRWLQPRDESEEPTPYIQVTVAFGYRPPKIVMVSGGRKIPVTEATISMFDWAEFENVDLVIRPYNWEAQGRSGVKAYLKTMYATIVEDEFDGKYRDYPDADDAPF